MREVREENSDSKKNVILLTVIAIATMVVVLVGATFAYLASSVHSVDQADIDASTNAGNDMFLINAGSDMELYADLENFYSGAGDISDNTEATVTLQTSSTEGVSYEYNAYVSVSGNDFEYTSGACYRKATLVDGADEATCKGNGNTWANTSTGYACYSGQLELVEGSFTNNSVGCLTSASNMWVDDQAAELVVDLYKADTTVNTQGACEVTGICVDKLHSIVDGITTQAACTAGNTWISSRFMNGMCYKPVATADLTEASENSNIQLLSNVSISVANGSVTDYYFAEATLINLNHNQIVNGNKAFNGMLTFEKVNA